MIPDDGYEEEFDQNLSGGDFTGECPPRRGTRDRKQTRDFDWDTIYAPKRGNTTEEEQRQMTAFVRTGDIGAKYTDPNYRGYGSAWKDRKLLYEKTGEKSGLDKIADATDLSGNSQETTAVAVSRDQTKIYIANQSGKATKAAAKLAEVDRISSLNYEVITTDEFKMSGLHAEMQIIYYFLVNGIDLGKIHVMGVAGGKGTCQMCASVLSKLGIGFSFIERSGFEKLWQDPWKLAKKIRPFEF